jgi:hypothetical protein
MRDGAEVAAAQLIASERNVARISRSGCDVAAMGIFDDDSLIAPPAPTRSDGRDNLDGEFDLAEVRACLRGASAAE